MVPQNLSTHSHPITPPRHAKCTHWEASSWSPTTVGTRRKRFWSAAAVYLREWKTELGAMEGVGGVVGKGGVWLHVINVDVHACRGEPM